MIALPKFSIVICNYNYAQFIGDAIESCLAQQYPTDSFEIIVVDDGSTDASRDVIERYAAHKSLRAIFQDNRGQAAALCAGIEPAKHELVCLLDSDDYFEPHKLAKLAERLSGLAPIPEHFFLCHDLNVRNHTENLDLHESWFERTQLDGYGDTVAIDSVVHDYAFSASCGQVYSLPLAQTIAASVPTWEWRQGADGVFAHAALVIAGAVNYLDSRLATYRVHGDNFFASIRDGRYSSNDKTARDRWPKLLYFLSELIDTLPLDEKLRATRIAYLKRLERIVRSASRVHRYALPTMSFIIDQGRESEQLTQSIDACLAQSYPKIEVIITRDTAAAPIDLLPRMAGSVRFVETDMLARRDREAIAYRELRGDYFCLLRSGDIPDPYFAERHVYVQRFSSLCALSSCDVRLIDTKSVLLHAGVFAAAQLWTRALEVQRAFSSAFEQWIFPPLSANVFRRNHLLELFINAIGTPEFEGISGYEHWLLLHYAQCLTGSARINETLMSLRVDDSETISYGRLLDPATLFGQEEDPDYDRASEIIFDLYCRNLSTFHRILSAQWGESLVKWLLADQTDELMARLRIIAARAGVLGSVSLAAS